MIVDLPSSDDFIQSGVELLDFAWDITANLFLDFEDFADWASDDKEVTADWASDDKEVTDEYWAAAKRKLSVSISTTQQGIEFLLKGKIAEISPYLLIADQPRNWPSPYNGAVEFSRFKTIDAQDLIKTYDIFSDTGLSNALKNRFEALRTKRNKIQHSIDKNIQIHALDVLTEVLEFYSAFFRYYGANAQIHFSRLGADRAKTHQEEGQGN